MGITDKEKQREEEISSTNNSLFSTLTSSLVILLIIGAVCIYVRQSTTDSIGNNESQPYSQLPQSELSVGQPTSTALDAETGWEEWEVFILLIYILCTYLFQDEDQIKQNKSNKSNKIGEDDEDIDVVTINKSLGGSNEPHPHPAVIPQTPIPMSLNIPRSINKNTPSNIVTKKEVFKTSPDTNFTKKSDDDIFAVRYLSIYQYIF